MAIDRDVHQVLVVFRSPPTLIALSTQDGRVGTRIETCGDADDVFVDAKRRRLYVGCGEGVVDALEQDETGYRHLARVPTVSGARTSFFVPELDRLFLEHGRRSERRDASNPLHGAGRNTQMAAGSPDLARTAYLLGRRCAST